MLAADGFPCDGLLLLAYPLHPAGRPEELAATRTSRKSRCRFLCLNGTRDALCRRDLMEGVVGRLTDRWTMHWLEGADHSFRVLKGSGRSDAEVLGEIAEALRRLGPFRTETEDLVRFVLPGTAAHHDLHPGRLFRAGMRVRSRSKSIAAHDAVAELFVGSALEGGSRRRFTSS